jgi:hypothetical protein
LEGDGKRADDPKGTLAVFSQAFKDLVFTKTAKAAAEEGFKKRPRVVKKIGGLRKILEFFSSQMST